MAHESRFPHESLFCLCPHIWAHALCWLACGNLMQAHDFWKRECLWRKCPIRLAYRVFSWLMIDVRGPSPLCVRVLLLAWQFQHRCEFNLSKPRRVSQEATLFYGLYFRSALASCPDFPSMTAVGMCKTNEPIPPPRCFCFSAWEANQYVPYVPHCNLT